MKMNDNIIKKQEPFELELLNAIEEQMFKKGKYFPLTKEFLESGRGTFADIVYFLCEKVYQQEIQIKDLQTEIEKQKQK